MIEYNDDLHTYTCLFNGEKYRSVTNCISKMEEHVDFDAIAGEYVKKNNREEIFKKLSVSWKITLKEAKEKWGEVEFTKESILKIWKDKSDFAKKVGHEYHKFKENKLIETTKKLKRPLHQQEIKKGLEYSFDLGKLKNGAYPEMILYNHEFKVAGKSDIVIIDGQYVDIEDHKTSEEITTKGTAFYNKDLNRKIVRMLRTPLNHLEAINYNEYALQLSAYGYMLEKHGYKVRTLQINHVLFENKELGIVKEVIPYKMPYLKKEAEAMFKAQLHL